ncbi:sensor histidine kinase [Massilia sp. Leaf139]|uniref:sensor histidine kinase n=1 Tax=Massilia sp. Leaf139 TaxID=1736272 RepID=UPI0006F7F880|nr:histidine kinase [Massilia sp. Leaf139]KQQ89182.1 histidine kinase [Massilia sp. Leaf139]
MMGAFGTRRGTALYLAAWALLGVLLAGLTVAAGDAPWGTSLLFTVPLSLVYGCASGFSSYYLCRAYPLASRALPAVLGVFTCTAVCASALWTAAGGGYAEVLRGLATGLPSMSRAFAALMFGLGVILYGLTAVAHYLALEFERARTLERRELEMKLAAQEAELRMLRTQIDPHFLFNSLNSISALTSIDPVAARGMTLQLSDFLRRSLGMDAQRKVALDEEIALAQAFLAIEQVRFGPRLRFEHAVGEGAGRCLLPPLLLQPLVENAVKHGIGNRLDGGTVRILAERAGPLLRIRVENDADEDEDGRGPAAGCGIGLANVRQRLLATYAHEASVHWARLDARFRVDIALPAEQEPLTES